MSQERVMIFDTTLRDGEQSPGASMNTAEKMRLAIQLEKLGIDVIEAGFPAASEGDLEAVSAIAGKLKRCEVAGLARASKNDIDQAWKELFLQNKPALPISMNHTDRDTRDSYYIHIKKVDTSPPSSITIERIHESDIMIIRDPDGRITVTNRLEDGEQEG